MKPFQEFLFYKHKDKQILIKLLLTSDLIVPSHFDIDRGGVYNFIEEIEMGEECNYVDVKRIRLNPDFFESSFFNDMMKEYLRVLELEMNEYKKNIKMSKNSLKKINEIIKDRKDVQN